MARPRIFVSSTFYDHRTLRAEVAFALGQLNFDTVLNERGDIPYSHDRTLDQSCYSEVERSDILVSIVGGRFGSASSVDAATSISEVELRTALASNKQLFIFVERPVHEEYRFWKQNRNVDAVRWTTVDDPRVFDFIDQLYQLPRNNAIKAFDTGVDIIEYLKEQLAGMFQRMLSDNIRQQQNQLTGDLTSALTTLKSLIEGVTLPTTPQATVEQALLPTHPLFTTLRKTLSVPYRVFFTTLNEMSEWLLSRGYRLVSRNLWDDPNVAEYLRTRNSARGEVDLLRIGMKSFASTGELKYLQPSEFDEASVSVESTIRGGQTAKSD